VSDELLLANELSVCSKRVDMKVPIKSVFLSIILSFLQVSCGARPASSPSTDDIIKVVEAFGKRLQSVSLLSPDVGQEIVREYSEFISPGLLEKWISDPNRAPGRMVSSPWPERIEVISISEISEDIYSVRGEIVEVTSSELISGGAKNTVPVQIRVESFDSCWLITEMIMDGNASNDEKTEATTRICVEAGCIQ
jgi:hypothetical protein